MDGANFDIGIVTINCFYIGTNSFSFGSNTIIRNRIISGNWQIAQSVTLALQSKADMFDLNEAKRQYIFDKQCNCSALCCQKTEEKTATKVCFPLWLRPKSSQSPELKGKHELSRKKDHAVRHCLSKTHEEHMKNTWRKDFTLVLTIVCVSQ